MVIKVRGKHFLTSLINIEQHSSAFNCMLYYNDYNNTFTFGRRIISVWCACVSSIIFPIWSTSNLPSLSCTLLVFLVLDVLVLFFLFACSGSIQLLTDQTGKSYKISSGENQKRWIQQGIVGINILTHLIVGTAKGSNSSSCLRSMGTEMRPGRS